MTTYNVHIYREMRLVFGGIEAGSPEAAASIARDKTTGEADSIDDCEGETIAALVDVQGDEEYEQSAPDRLRARAATQGCPETAGGPEGLAGRPAKSPGFPMYLLRP